MVEPRAPASAARRRLLAALGIAPLAASLPLLARAPVVPFGSPDVPGPLNVVMAEQIGVGSITADKLSATGRVEVTPFAIRVFDATGRLRVVAGRFDPFP